MPTSTRRRNRMDDSEDESEAAPSTQRRTQASNNIASSSSAGPSRPQRTTSSNTSHSIDISTEIRPQALNKDHVPNIKSLMADLKSQDTTILKCIELLIETADQVAEAFSMQDDCQELEQADLDLRELIDAQAEKAIRRKVLEEISQDLHMGMLLEDPAQRYKTEVTNALATYNKQTSRKKYSKNTDYHNFKNALWVAKHEGAMPPVRDLIPEEPSDENDNDSDDELQMGGATQNFRCPLTTNILEDPVSNTKCTHSYTRSAIEAYVGGGNNKCPASGCQALVDRGTLETDPQLTKKVAAFKRREEERLIARRQTSTVLY